jgi:hypothetical protein
MTYSRREPAFTYDYETVWSGQRTDPSLLSDYSRPSALADLCADSPHQRKVMRKTIARQQRRTYLKNKAHSEYLELRCGR